MYLQVGVIVSQDDKILCDISIRRMGCKLQMRTFDMVVDAEVFPWNCSRYDVINNEKNAFALCIFSAERWENMNIQYLDANGA